MINTFHSKINLTIHQLSQKYIKYFLFLLLFQKLEFSWEIILELFYEFFLPKCAHSDSIILFSKKFKDEGYFIKK